MNLIILWSLFYKNLPTLTKQLLHYKLLKLQCHSSLLAILLMKNCKNKSKERSSFLFLNKKKNSSNQIYSISDHWELDSLRYSIWPNWMLNLLKMTRETPSKPAERKDNHLFRKSSFVVTIYPCRAHACKRPQDDYTHQVIHAKRSAQPLTGTLRYSARSSYELFTQLSVVQL